jgi:hypothetical protein
MLAFQPMLKFENDRVRRTRPGAQRFPGLRIREDDDEFAVGALNGTAVHLAVRRGNLLEAAKEGVL